MYIIYNISIYLYMYTHTHTHTHTHTQDQCSTCVDEGVLPPDQRYWGEKGNQFACFTCFASRRTPVQRDRVKL